MSRRESPGKSGEPRLRVDGYVRVSRVHRRRGERFISADVQREQIEQWASARDARLLNVFEELNESGARADRPRLEKAIARVEAGISGGVVVARIDRFGRSLRHGLAAIERIHAAGGTFVAVQDGLDISTPTGRLVLRLLLSIAEWEHERIVAGWEISQERAVARGAFVGCYVPVGYRRLKSGRLRVDPIIGPVVTELFVRRVGGASVPQLCRLLEEGGVLTPAGNPGWTFTTMRGLLANRAYLGEVRWGPYFRAAAHPALTDPATWERAQHPLRRGGSTRTAHEVLLAGLTRCASCSMTMSRVWWHANGRKTQSVYICRGRSAWGPCPAPASIHADELEAFVETVALELVRRRRQPPHRRAEKAHERLRDADGALAAYRDSDRVLHTLGVAQFELGLTARAERVRNARLEAAAAQTAIASHELPSARELEREWPTMTIIARREVIEGIVDCVFVQPGLNNIAERITVCRAGTAPARLPSNGDRSTRARPFRPRKPRPNKRPLHLWPRARVRRELAKFLGVERIGRPTLSFAPPGSGGSCSRCASRKESRHGRSRSACRSPSRTLASAGGPTSASFGRSSCTYRTGPHGRSPNSFAPMACARFSAPSSTPVVFATGERSSPTHRHARRAVRRGGRPRTNAGAVDWACIPKASAPFPSPGAGRLAVAARRPARTGSRSSGIGTGGRFLAPLKRPAAAARLDPGS